jgi:hypothetical protein
VTPNDGEVLHFSEDPNIRTFVPHVAETAQQPEPYVWAVAGDQLPAYWFPRHCPRGTAWVGESTTNEDRDLVFGRASRLRVHAIEYEWLDAMRTTRLYAYRFDATAFQPFSAKTTAPPYAFVATQAVTPLGPAEPVGDLLTLHEAAEIELRVLPNLWPFWDAVTASTLGFSGIRLAGAKPRP